MPQFLIKIVVHIVWSRKDRVRMIDAEIEPRLFAYIRGIVKNNGGRMIVAGGDAYFYSTFRPRSASSSGM